MARANVSPDGQLTIPHEMRLAMGLEHGGSVELVEFEPGQFTIVPLTATTERLKGMLRKPGVHFSIDDMNEIVRRKVALAAK